MIIIFISVVLVLALFSAVQFNTHDIKLNFFIFLYTIFFGTFITAFNRDTLDYGNYVVMVKDVGDIYAYMAGSTEQLHGDFTFFILSAFSNTLGLDAWFVFGIIGFISISIVCYVIVRCSPAPVISIFIYLSHSFINKEMIQRRAGLATAFALLAIYYLAHKKKARSVGSLSLMVLSHSSSIFVFAPIVMYKFVSKEKFRILAVFFLGAATIFNFLGGFSYFLQLFPNIIPQKVLLYSGWDKYNFEIGLFSPSVLRALVFSGLSIYYFNRFSENSFLVLSFTFYIAATCFLIIFNDFAILASRVSSILFCVECILVPIIFKCANARFGYLIAWLYGVLILANNIVFVGLGTVRIF